MHSDTALRCSTTARSVLRIATVCVGTLLVSTVVRPPIQIAAQESTTYYAPQRVNVREGPGTEFSILNTLSVGQEVPVGAVMDGGWAPIIHPSGRTMGFVLASLMVKGRAPTDSTPKPQPPSQGWITGCEDGALVVPSVNIWSTPNKGRVLGALSGTSRGDACRGAEVDILETSADRAGNRQYRVRSKVNGLTGWVTYWFVIRN